MTTRSRYDPERHQRQSIRKPGWNYAGPGRYFVTVCSFDRETIFGEVLDGEVVLNEIGRIVEQTWLDIDAIHPFVTLDHYVVMPNHIHGIIEIAPMDRAASAPASLRHPAGATPQSLGSIVAGFKAAATKRVNQLPDTGTSTIWQRGYHDRIIPDDDILDRARRYIHTNPNNWPRDPEHPANIDRQPLS